MIKRIQKIECKIKLDNDAQQALKQILIQTPMITKNDLRELRCDYSNYYCFQCSKLKKCKKAEAKVYKFFAE